jgi:hypothetical protein
VCFLARLGYHSAKIRAASIIVTTRGAFFWWLAGTIE